MIEHSPEILANGEKKPAARTIVVSVSGSTASASTSTATPHSAPGVSQYCGDAPLVGHTLQTARTVFVHCA